MTGRARSSAVLLVNVCDRAARRRLLWPILIVAATLSCRHPGDDAAARAEADTERDLAAGAPVIMIASGVARYVFTADIDPETGLPFRDTGCTGDPRYNDAYNATIRRWIAAHGLPKSSLKSRLLDGAAIDEALRGGVMLSPGAARSAANGLRVELRGALIHLEGGPFARPYEIPLGSTDAVRFAPGPSSQVLIEVTGPRREGFSGHVRVQVDPGCHCLLQVLK